MAEQIKLEIVTPEKEIFRDMVDSFILPTAMGLIGVLSNHSPLMTVVVPGVLKYYKNNKEEHIAVSTGFMELKDNGAEILVSSAELAKNIDRARAEAAAERAKMRLADTNIKIDHARAEAALKRAMARLNALK
jgi:F-type H+-transporting ATPase subunit epsilon